MESFGERLKRLRKEANLTQADFAEKINVHLQTVSKWERGKSEPDIAQMGEIAKVLNISLEKLFGAEESGQTYEGTFSAESLGQLICSLRTDRNESQEQLSIALEISPDTVSRWERGITCPDVEKLSALSVHFNLPLSKLYYGISEQHENSVVHKVKSKQTVFLWLISVIAVLCVAAMFLAIFLPRNAKTPSIEYYSVTINGKEYEVTKDEWFVTDKPEKTGYDFVCWLDEKGSEVTFPRKITEDCVFTAKYAVHDYNIDYWLNGGSFTVGEVQNVFNVESGDMSLLTPSKTGATFEGWYLASDYSGNAVEQVICKANDIHLYAKWSDNTFTVLYELNGGVLYESNPSLVSSDSEITLNNPIRKGYLFLGWYDLLNENERYSVVGGTNAKNLTLSAVWQKSDASFNIEYHLYGGELTTSNPEKVNAGERHLLNQPTKIGHNFVGWNSKADGTGEYYEYLLGIQSDLELHATYEAKQYLIRYEYDGIYENGYINPNYITYGETVALNPVYKYGYTFTGWFDDEVDGKLISEIDESNILEISILYARFSPIVYQIVLDANGGTMTTPDGQSQTYTYELKFNEKLTLPDCIKGGYVFLGWINKAGKQIEEINSLNIADMTLTAKWRESDKRYSITYELDGGVLDEENPSSVLCGQVIGLNEPDKEHYIFLGWYDNAEGSGNKYEFTPADREADLTLYALWQEIKVSGSYTDFVYEKNLASGTVTITGYNGAYGENVDLVIPSVIEGLPVVAIEGIGGYGNYQTLQSLTIPEGIVELGESAFEGFQIIQPLTIPASVENIGKACFRSCGFQSLLFAENSKLKIIEESGFERIQTVDGIVLPEQLEMIEYKAFYYVSISGIILPRSLKRIGGEAIRFNMGESCKYINVFVPNSVEFIGAAAVSNAIYEKDCTPITLTLHNDEETSVLNGNAFELPKPNKQGYTFIGWKYADGKFAPQWLSTDKDTELYAVYDEINEHDGRELNRAYLIRPNEEYSIFLRGDTKFYLKPEDMSLKSIVVSCTVPDYGHYMLDHLSYYNSSGEQIAPHGYNVKINLTPEGYFCIIPTKVMVVIEVKIKFQSTN